MDKIKQWKMVVVIWLAIYPFITIVFLLFGEYLAWIAFIPLRTFVMTIVLIPTMVFILMPLVTRLLRNWLER